MITPQSILGHFPNLRLILFALIFVWLILIIYGRFLLDNVSENRNNYIPYKFRQLNNSHPEYSLSAVDNQTSLKIILFWTTYFGKDYLRVHESNFEDSPVPLHRVRLCEKEYPNCRVTSDERYLSQANAVVFHWRDFSSSLPSYRSPEQLWTLYNMEAPPNTPKLIDKTDLYFNLTATYRTDSDIVISYGKVIRRDVPLANSDPELKVDLRFKTKPIAWFVSNCFTQSKREIYVKELTRFIQVDIYGQCGNLVCSRADHDRCFLKVEREYLFYLSFENSLCTDYVTEKLFNVMKYGIIPVVFGSANYSSFMPPNSYIDATKLKPKKLAHKMIEISNNKRLYLRYFAWRKQFQVAEGSSSDFVCEMCRYLQKPSTQKSRSAKEINDWYFNSCKSENQFFR